MSYEFYSALCMHAQTPSKRNGWDAFCVCTFRFAFLSKMLARESRPVRKSVNAARCVSKFCSLLLHSFFFIYGNVRSLFGLWLDSWRLFAKVSGCAPLRWLKIWRCCRWREGKKQHCIHTHTYSYSYIISLYHTEHTHHFSACHFCYIFSWRKFSWID